MRDNNLPPTFPRYRRYEKAIIALSPRRTYRPFQNLLVHQSCGLYTNPVGYAHLRVADVVLFAEGASQYELVSS